MSRQDFTDTLAYGACEGSVRAVSPDCVDRNPGKKWRPCPVNVVDNINADLHCNCCDKCRNNCNWMAQIKEVNKRESEERWEQIKKDIGPL